MIKVLSHFDLDGISCVINLWNATRNKHHFEYKLSSYNYLDKTLSSLIRGGCEVLWVTDLNFTEEQIKNLTKIKNDTRVIYVDHHVYEYDVKEITCNTNVTTFVDKKHCGALNTFLCLSKLSNGKKTFWNENKEKLIELNRIVDVYDRWQKYHPLFKEKAIPLNDLFWEYKFEKFFLKFRDGYKLDDEDHEVITKKSLERDLYLTESIENYSYKNNDTKSLFILNPKGKFANDFTLYYPDYEFYVILKEISNEMYEFSIRINEGNDFTIGLLINELKKKDIEISAGGHNKSGGMSVEKSLIDEFLDKINNIFGELVNARSNNIKN